MSGASITSTLLLDGVVGSALCILIVAFRHSIILAPNALNHKTPLTLQEAFSLEENELVTLIGLDSYVLLRFIIFCIKLTAITSITSLLILMPIYYQGSGSNQDIISRSSFANLDKDDTAAYVALGFIYGYTILFLLILQQECDQFVLLRHAYYTAMDFTAPDQANFSIIIENIPPFYRSEAELSELFESIFAGAVHSCILMDDTQPFNTLINKRDSLILQIERSGSVADPSSVSREKIEQEVNILRLVRELNEVNSQLSALQNEVARTAHCGDKGTSTAFMTFTSFKAWLISTSLLLFTKCPHLVIEAAPSLRDIIWKNVR